MASDEDDVDVGFVFDKKPSILNRSNPLVERRLTNKGYVAEGEFVSLANLVPISQ